MGKYRGDNVSQGNMGDNFRQYMNSDWEIYRQKAELEMEVLFAPELFRSIPWASSLGNHEANFQGEKFGSVTRWHYNLPNDDGVTGTVYSNALGAPNTHGNFWFRNGDVLVIGITAVQYANSVFPNSQPEDHVKYIQAAMDANKDAKWRVLINHVPPYSFIGGFAEPPILRQRFADMNIDQFDFDVVFTGHQHSYSRSKQLLTDDDTKYQNITSSYGSNSGKTNKFITPEIVSEDAIVRETDENGYSYDIATNPEGTVHINISPFQWNSAGGNAHPDYTDFLEVIVTDEKHFMPQTIGSTNYGVHYSHTGADIIASQQPVEWNAASGGTYVFVTVTKTAEGQEMKFELRQISTGKVLDTYIIKKTN